MQQITAPVSWPYWFYKRVDLATAAGTVFSFLQQRPGNYFLIQKVFSQWPTPGAVPVFTEITAQMEVTNAGKTLFNIPIPFAGFSSPGKGITGGGFWRPPAQLNAKWIGWVVGPAEIARISISGFAPSVAGAYIDLLVAGRTFKERRIG